MRFKLVLLPPPADSPPWAMPNVLIIPRPAGYRPYLDDRRYAIIGDNCQAVLAGMTLRNVVDKTAWF